MNKICAQFLRIIQKPKNYSACVALGRNYSFKSDLSLETLYPNSKLKIFTPPPPQRTDGKFNGYIPLNKLEITYSRSSGPGGQNVNTVNTKVDVRFHVPSADWIPDAAKKRLTEEFRHRINKEGFYIARSDVTRSQQLNLADALQRIRELIRSLEVEQPELSTVSFERTRRRLERANRERLALKREHSAKKAERQIPEIDLK